MDMMEFNFKMRNIDNLNDYIEFTLFMEGKLMNTNIVLNMSTLLLLKSIRSLEIEYFNKCDGNGAAFKIFKRMVSNPPSRAWELCGYEVVVLMKYWLDAVRMHLISHHRLWWNFLNPLLDFMKEITQKDANVSNTLVQQLSECMLELATGGKPDVCQKHVILDTFNLVCAKSSRDIRLSLRAQLEPYFIRVSTVLASCGHVPTQLSSLECLLRWLVPRHCAAARQDAARKWLQPHLYPKPCKQIFLERTWKDFHKDARDFVNRLNEAQELVTSVPCTRMTCGDRVLISGLEHRGSWLDLNLGGCAVTAAVEVDATAGDPQLARDTVSIPSEAVQLAVLTRGSPSGAVLSLQCVAGALLGDVTCALAPRDPAHAHRLVRALRALFPHNAQILVDVDSLTYESPAEPRTPDTGGETTRFNHPLKKIPKQRCGFVSLMPRNTLSKSPSSVSTTSLAQLHNKLANLPDVEFTKEPVAVSARPELSVVSELSETEQSLGSDNTLKLQRCAVRTFRGNNKNKKYQSDPETHPKDVYIDIQKQRGSQSAKCVSNTTIPYQEKMSSLFAATIGSTDESVVSETVQRLCKEKELTTDNLMDLLVQEALRDKVNEDGNRLSDNGINAKDSTKTQEEHKQDNEIIENTQFTGLLNSRSKSTALRKDPTRKLSSEVISKSTSNESNTEVISDTRSKSTALRKDPTRKLSSEVISKSTSNESNTEVISDTRSKSTALRKDPTRKLSSEVISKSTSNESNTEVISDTPVCYVNVRKRIPCRKSLNNNKTESSDDNAAFDLKSFEGFFSQHFVEHQTGGEVIVSPNLAKKNKQSTSESSEYYILKDIANELDIRNENIADLDIVECLDDIVDKVCNDFDKCTTYLKKQEENNEILKLAKDLTRAPHTKEPAEETSPSTEAPTAKRRKKNLRNTKPKRKQTTKSKPPSKSMKPAGKTKGKLIIEPVSKMSTILEVNTESDANKTVVSDIEKHLANTTNKTPIARKKRKLYSPKDEQIDDGKCDSEVSISEPLVVFKDDDDVTLDVIKKDKMVTPKASTSCYEVIEKERKIFRRNKIRKSKSVAPPPSPKTKRLDDVFERLKENIEIHENENITIIDKNSNKNVAIYNFTSDSEDEDFIQQRMEIQKRRSTTTIGSGTSIISTRGCNKNKITTEDRKESTNRIKQKRKRATKRKQSNKSRDNKINRPVDLIDERIRQTVPEQLNTSFDTTKNDNVDKDAKSQPPPPKIQAHEMEAISDEHTVEDFIKSDIKSQNLVKKQKEKKTTKVKQVDTNLNHEKQCSTVIEGPSKADSVSNNRISNTKDDDRTISPLPGLFIETDEAKNEVEDSFSSSLVKKMQKVYKCGFDDQNPITVQNELSHNEERNVSPQTIIAEEIGRNSKDQDSNTSKKKKTNVEDKENSDVIDDTMNSDRISITSRTNTSKTIKRTLRLKPKKNTISSLDSSSVKDITRKNSAKAKTPIINDSQKSKSSIKSQINEINLDDFTYTDNEKVKTRSATKTKPINKEAVIIDLECESLAKSVRSSIASEGVTTHGYMNEVPVSPKHLGKKSSPRRVQDMEQSNKLNVTVVERPMVKSLEDEQHSEASSVKSNKGHTHNLYVEADYELVKALPSPHTSETYNSVISRMSSTEWAKCLPLDKINASSSLQSVKKSPEIVKILVSSSPRPIVSISRISSVEVSKWMPLDKTSPRRSLRLDERAKNTTTSSQKLLDKTTSSHSLRLDERANNTTKSSHDTTDTPSETNYKKNHKIKNTVCNGSKRIKNRKSQISPIHVSEFMIHGTRGLLNLHSFEEESIKLDRLAQKYFTSPSSRTDRSNSSTPKIGVKRKSPRIMAMSAKSRKFDKDIESIDITEEVEAIDVSTSKQSSKIEDWIKNMPTTSRDTNDVIIDALKTTLTEIDQNIRKDYNKFCMEVQNQLESMVEERRQEHVETAKALITEMIQIVDTKFAQLDQREEHLISEWMRGVRERAGEVLSRGGRRTCAVLRDLLAAARDEPSRH